MGFEFEITNREQLKELITKFVELSKKKTPSINDIKDKSKIQTYFINKSRASLNFRYLIDLYEEDIEKAIDYVCTKVKYPFCSEVSEQEQKELEEEEKKILKEEKAELSEVIDKVQRRVEMKMKSAVMNAEQTLEEIKQYAEVTDEERRFFRNELIDTIKVVRIEQGGRTFEVKDNISKGVLTIRIPSKFRIEIDRQILIKYGMQTGSNIIEYQDFNITFNQEEGDTEKIDEKNGQETIEQTQTTATLTSQNVIVNEDKLTKIEKDLEKEAQYISTLISSKPKRGRRPTESNPISQRKKLEDIEVDDIIQSLKSYGDYYKLISYMVSAKRFGSYKDIDKYLIDKLRNAYKNGVIKEEDLRKVLKGKKLKTILEENND